MRKIDFLSFAAEKERQRLQKIAQLRSEAINETESVVQPSKVELAHSFSLVSLALMLFLRSSVKKISNSS